MPMDTSGFGLQLDLLDQQLAANLRGDFEEGWRLSQLLEKERPQDDRAMFNRGWHYMHQGDLQKGFEAFEAGRREGVFGAPLSFITSPRFTGSEDIEGKTVLLYGEGGYGDEIMNVRFAKHLQQKGARVVVACNQGLTSLFKRVEGVNEVVTLQEAQTTFCDYYVPAMSAALALRLSFKDLSQKPYLQANPTMYANWAPIIKGAGLKVGIRWSGNPRFEHEQHRRFPAEPLIALSEIPGVTVYSLQRDDDLRDLPSSVIDLGPLLTTWEDTVAVMSHLDLIITSDTSTNHLSGALGKETWTILPILPYYPWAQPGNKSAWYETTTLFRQETFGNWDAPLANVRRALLEKVGATAKVSSFAMSLPSEKDSQKGTETSFQNKTPFVPGLYIAPSPVSFSSSSSQKTLHFVAGLPRCGSTALISLLAQNPRIYGAPISGLSGMFGGIHANWDKSEFHVEMPNPEAKKRTLKALLENYHETDKPILLDKDRQWVSHIALLEEILQRPIKVLVLVRPLPETLASFEVLRRKTPLFVSSADEALGPTSTIASRAAYFAGETGAVGLAYNGLKDAVTSGHLNRMLFIDYNKLTAAPKTQLQRIYQFLEEPYYDHELQRVEQIAFGDSSVHKFLGLHDIRSVFKKESQSAREVLGGDVFGQYDHPEPWKSWT